MNMEDQFVTNLQTEKENSMTEIFELKTHKRGKSMIVFPAGTDVFKTSSRRLKKVTTSYDQTRRRHDVWKKTSDLRRLEDV